MSPRKKAYRKLFKQPPKGCKPYKNKERWPQTPTNRRNNAAHITPPISEGVPVDTPSTNVHVEAPLSPSPHVDTPDCSSCPNAPVASEVLAAISVCAFEGFDGTFHSFDGFEGFGDEVTEAAAMHKAWYEGVSCNADILEAPSTYKLTRKPIRVLSLFDGISCGLCALHELGLVVEVYYSSEIDISAIAVQKFQHNEAVTPLGCIKSLTNDVLRSLGRIDLLLAGPPCNDLSIVNPRRRGLRGPGSSGQLFFEFLRILKWLQGSATEKGNALFWLMENTAALEKETLKEMSSLLQRNPVTVCASQFVGMKRRRNFWGNLPCMDVSPASSVTSKNLQAALRPYRQAAVQLLNTVTSTSHSQLVGTSKLMPVVEDGVGSYLFVTELEKLFGLPDHYTDVGNLSVTTRRKLIGRGWCVPVVCYLLQPISQFFKRNED